MFKTPLQCFFFFHIVEQRRQIDLPLFTMLSSFVSCSDSFSPATLFAEHAEVGGGRLSEQEPEFCASDCVLLLSVESSLDVWFSSMLPFVVAMVNELAEKEFASKINFDVHCLLSLWNLLCYGISRDQNKGEGHFWGETSAVRWTKSSWERL